MRKTMVLLLLVLAFVLISVNIMLLRESPKVSNAIRSGIESYIDEGEGPTKALMGTNVAVLESLLEIINQSDAQELLHGNSKHLDAFFAGKCEFVEIAIVMDAKGEFHPCGCAVGQNGGLLRALSIILHMKSRRNFEGVLLGPNNHERTGNAHQESIGDVERELVRKSVDAMFGLLPIVKESSLGGTSDSSEGMIDAGNTGVGLSLSEVGVGRVVLRVSKGVGHNISVAEISETVGVGGADVFLRPPLDGAREILVISMAIPKTAEFSGSSSLSKLKAHVWMVQQGLESPESLEAKRLRMYERLIAGEILISPTYITVESKVEPNERGVVLYTALQRELAKSFANQEGDSSLLPWDYEVKTCAGCHSEVSDKWTASSPHKNALETLQGAGIRGKSDYCVSCHVTPLAELRKRSGHSFVAGVSCSSCHIDAKRHSQQPQKFKPTRPTASFCLGCHDQKQSPEFSGSYFERLPCSTR
ncbi:MAG: hypothetical protein KDB07_10110 [Planctomycetes bacterium]|nr:hypothetical protein [Planctomycetota bacterium]